MLVSNITLQEDTPDSNAHDWTFLRRFCFPFPPTGNWVPTFQAEAEVQGQELCFFHPGPAPAASNPLRLTQHWSVCRKVSVAPQPVIYGTSLKTHAPECLLAQELIPWRCVRWIRAAQTCSAEEVALTVPSWPLEWGAGQCLVLSVSLSCPPISFGWKLSRQQTHCQIIIRDEVLESRNLGHKALFSLILFKFTIGTRICFPSCFLKKLYYSRVIEGLGETMHSSTHFTDTVTEVQGGKGLAQDQAVDNKTSQTWVSLCCCPSACRQSDTLMPVSTSQNFPHSFNFK